jgi:5-methylcytosine-specific restriction protein B
MMPSSEAVKDIIIKDIIIKDIEIKALLEKINERIEYLYDRDHTIGHAYFMSLKGKDGNKAKDELDNIFRNKIIPLLQEYFYDDWEKIQIVLGDHPEQFKAKNVDKKPDYQFIQETKLEEKNVLGFDHPDIENDSIKYKVNESFAPEAYIKIYGEYPPYQENKE